MARVYVGVLGPTNLSLDGIQRHLTPLTVKLLLRLIAAEGESVPADQIYRDVWETPANGRVERGERNEVQKRILELRRAIDPGDQSRPSRILRTEQMIAARLPKSAYRLVLAQDQLDYLEFTDLVNRAAAAAPATVVALLTRALALWRGRPLADVTGRKFATPLIQRLLAFHVTARKELIRAHAELGSPDLALPIAEELVSSRPDDPDAAESLRALREQLRGRHAGEVLRRDFPKLGVSAVVRLGDLFEQDDANLAVGFGDTFDTCTDEDASIISRESVQGQLLERVYHGDRGRLDMDLRKALRGVMPVARETVQDKPKGKRTRYPVGTVAALPAGGRRVFAFVHCRQGLDLVTRSSARELHASLDRLWRSARVHGLLRPVAIPLVGSGLARVTELSREQLMMMIIETFLASCRDERCTAELRIVLRPSDVERVRMPEVARFVEALDEEGRRPHE
jgi:Domain of unknown function (DUF6430)/Bacterial transcriptional activator domain/Transcriptional regulatory protein, C terminal